MTAPFGGKTHDGGNSPIGGGRLEIGAHPDTMRAVSQSLRNVGDDLDGLLPDIKDLIDTVEHEAAKNTSGGSAAPMFSPLLEALGASAGKVRKGIETSSSMCVHHADVLKQLADQFEANEHKNSSKINNIPTTSV
ncbi:hypothetical protein B5P44_01085 [Mycobacterium sp. CBMA 213]|uniref:ESX-1 secretion-associated protein EspF n=1 Tax=Mycolicibacterium sp. CBMA 213 TaxID=1968788 RepID=A0A343VRK9_9MYCO|nr:MULTISPECIES: hypothetical protein [unclassified Mycolicibacterium]AVN58533.1 hypothetical protein B5P44_p00238 [Mycolicibacterium sp. CBMA 213]MUL61178.1 hypothetical protein [Mycolicibacterium sp. CBMA 335]MUM03415.1 hypothetical protein [Mycolicibacterium sp. CBMA 213]